MVLRPKHHTQRDEWHRNPHRRTAARKALGRATTWPTTCPGCGRTLNPFDDWHLGHIKPRRIYPELMWDPDNHRVECADCNRRGGGQLGQAIQSGRITPPPATQPLERATRALGATEPATPYPSATPGDARSLRPVPTERATGPSRVSPLFPRIPSTTNENIHGVAESDAGSPEHVESSPDQFAGVPWVMDLAGQMGPEDVWPRLMTGPHPNATGSYGPEWVARIDARRAADMLVPEHEKPLRWFQRLVITRAGEHDAAGRLVWETVLTTSNRQVGKSVLVREVALDRPHQAARLGEEQLVLHIARDLQVAEEVQLPARLWARARRQELREGGERDPGFKAIDTNGKCAVHVPGGRWLSRSEKGAYGYSASMPVADECWDIGISTVTNGIQKTMAARREPQLWMFSTSHEDCTPLFPTFRERALGELWVPGRTLLVEWSAPPGVDERDVSGWRAASPWWDARRRELIAGDVGMPGFREQWLNIWPRAAAAVAAEVGVPLVDRAVWVSLVSPRPSGPPACVAVDSWFGDDLVVAGVWRSGSGVWVSVEQAGSLTAARDAVAGLGAPRVLVGKQHASHQVWDGLPVEALSLASLPAVLGVAGLVASGEISHDGGVMLGEQLAAARRAEVDGVNGPRLLPGARSHAVRAAWAACRVVLEPQQQSWFSAGGGRA